MKKGFGYYLIMVFLSATGLVLAFVVLQFALFFVITFEFFKLLYPKFINI